MTDQRLADRLNAEPCIFRGCSSSELGAIVGFAVLFWLPAGLILAWLAGAPGMGLGIAAAAIVPSVLIAANVLERLKRSRPEAYYRHQILLQLAGLKLIKPPFIDRQGHWGLGRSRGPLR